MNDAIKSILCSSILATSLVVAYIAGGYEIYHKSWFTFLFMGWSMLVAIIIFMIIPYEKPKGRKKYAKS
jgi:hypothetical protein